MVSRWPWKAHHTGFVIAHIGILTLLAGSLVSLHRGLDSNMPLYEGETSDRVSLLEKAIHVSIPATGARGSFPVAFEKRPPTTGREQRFPVPQSDVTLVAEAFEPHVDVHESFEPAESGSPALHFVLQAPMATQDAWLRADDSSRSHHDLGMVSFGFHTAATEEEVQELLRHSEGRNHLSFVQGPGGPLRFAASGDAGAPVLGKVKVGEPLPTGWPALAVTVDKYFEKAALKRTVTPATPPQKEERRMSAVRVRLEGKAARSEPEWILWTEARTLPFAGGRVSRRLPLARGLPALQGDAPEVQLRQVPGLQHGRDLRELGEGGRSRERGLRAPHLDEPPDALPRLHLLPGVLRGRDAHDVDLLRGPRAGSAPRVPGGGAHRHGGDLDVLRQAVPGPAAGRPGPRGTSRTGEPK